jgi:alanine-synthesizing transaminase
MNKEFHRLNSLPPYALGAIATRVHALRKEGHDVIDLSQINPDLPPPQSALDTLIQSSLLPHNHRYTSTSGISVLRAAFSTYYKSRFSAELDPDHEIVLTSGTKEGLSHLLLGILSPGDTALVPVPAYPLHTASVCLADGCFIGFPLWKSHDDMLENNSIITSKYDFFFTEIKERYSQVWPKPRILIVSFPHNPTTTIASLCFYERLLDFANAHDLLIINDFAHGDLFFEDSRCTSLLSVPGARDCAVELYSLSKGYSLGGWRIGCAAGSRKYLDALKKIKSYVDFGTFQPLQIASAKLLSHEGSLHPDECLADQNRQLYRSRQEVLVEGLRELGWRVPEIHASPFVWAEIPEAYHSYSTEYFIENLLLKKLVACSPGTGFHETCKYLIRFSLSHEESRLREALARIEKFQDLLST